jgi:hypothetical protein
MDSSENIGFTYLSHQGFKDVVYEPDGNVPPDFLLDGHIAVEVRRLNQNEQTASGSHGLEEVAKPLWARMNRLVESLGPPTAGASWYVCYRFRRPVPPWKRLEPRLRAVLRDFRDGSNHERARIDFGDGFHLQLLAAGTLYPTFFVLGGCVDRDSGGWVLPELERNLRICVAEKSRKVSRVRAKYPEWWLLLVDHIGHGLSKVDREQFRQQLRMIHDWDKIILVDPLNPKRAFEL